MLVLQDYVPKQDEIFPSNELSLHWKASLPALLLDIGSFNIYQAKLLFDLNAYKTIQSSQDSQDLQI